jgi:hypothetical protein
VNRGSQAGGLQVFGQQGCRTGPVDVIVAEDGHALAPVDRLDQPLHRGLHAGQRGGIRHGVAQARLEEALAGRRGLAARRQDTGQQVRHAMVLANRLGLHIGGAVQPVAPHAAQHRAFNPQQRTAHRKPIETIHSDPRLWTGVTKPEDVSYLFVCAS